MGRPKRNRKKAPEEKQKNGATYITKAGLTMHCSICGKANHNKKGHYKYIESVQMDEQEVVQAGEEAEVDDPTTLQHIISQNRDPRFDPTHVHQCMVYKMGQEESTHVTTGRVNGPLPKESSFVAAARATIPPPRQRVTTATVRGKRGRASTSTNGRGRSSRRGRGTGHVQGEAIGRARTTEQVQARGRTTSRKRGRTVADNDEANTSTRSGPISDLNVSVDADEVPVTQSAPIAPCCPFECTSYNDCCLFV